MIEELQKAMLDLPQAEVETRHYFLNGIYAREITIPKDVCLVGAKHKTSFAMVISKGECVIKDGNEEIVLKAGQTIISKVGAKRAIFAIQETVLTTFHPTQETDIGKIESDIIEPEGLRIANNPKELIK